MGFNVIQGTSPLDVEWYGVDITTATNLYVGQLVQLSTGAMNGVGPLAAASGAYDVSGDQQILGIVIGTNNYPMTELFSATYGQYISGVASQAGQKAIQKMGGGSYSFPINDPAPRVLVAIINNTTWLEGSIYNATVGVAPTVVTVTTGDATGAGCTTGSCDVATVANMCTLYFRTGLNAGRSRIIKSASATTHTFDEYFPDAIAVGDTGVIVPLRQGGSYAQITSTSGYLGMGFNCAATAATNYFGIDVKYLDLAEAGKERVVFRFNASHFAGIRT
jgi:hypothetical protein